MPVIDRAEAVDLDQAIARVVQAQPLEQGLQSLRRVFVEKLDFSPAAGAVAVDVDGVIGTATRVAQRDGVRVVALALPAAGSVTTKRLSAYPKSHEAGILGV